MDMSRRRKHVYSCTFPGLAAGTHRSTGGIRARGAYSATRDRFIASSTWRILHEVSLVPIANSTFTVERLFAYGVSKGVSDDVAAALVQEDRVAIETLVASFAHSG